MATHEEDRFSVLVERSFSVEQESARTLWVRMAQEFDREGPGAAKEYLAAQRQMLVDQVKRLLDPVKERIDG